MSLRHRLFFACLTLAGTLFAAGAAQADGPLILQMADGSYFNPASGLSDPDRGHLLERLGFPADTAATSTPEVPISEPAPAPVTPPLIAAVQRAHDLLQAQIASQTGKPKVVTSYNVWVNVTLALWNSKTDQIRLVDVEKNGTKLKMVTEDPGMSVRVATNNGVNSRYAVDDGDTVVVAVKYPTFTDVSVSRRKPRYELHDVVYSPYSAGLHQAEMVAYGKATLEDNIAKAYAAYRTAGTRSRAFPDKLLADVVDPQLVESIAVIEHLNIGSLQDGNARSALESVFVTVGANQGDAFDYARSSAGAMGLVQFIPSTYALMAKRADLGLIKDFKQGMSDPVNALKAEIAYLDASLATMPLAVKDLYYVDNDRVKEYLAASYNAGDIRVRRAIAQWGDGWSDEHAADIAKLAKKKGARSVAVKKLKNATLHAETIDYVKKMRAALALLRPPPPIQT